MMRSSIRKLSARFFARTMRKSPRRCRLALEPLETRCFLSALGIHVANHVSDYDQTGLAPAIVRTHTKIVTGTIAVNKTVLSTPTTTNGGGGDPSIVVNNPSDIPVTNEIDLRQAIVEANSNGGDETITFDPTVFQMPQTIDLNPLLGQLELSDTTGTETITGPAAGVTVDAGGQNRVFQVDALVTASISGLTITGGNAASNSGGGTYAYAGGGLYNLGAVTLTNCTVSGNAAVFGGGGVFNNSGSLEMIDCTVSGNSGGSGYGGGVYAGGLGGAVTALTNCTISGNYAYFGGGFYDRHYGTAALVNCTVSGNSGFNGSGAYCGGGSITLGNTIVAGNTGRSTRPDVSTYSTGAFVSNGNNLIGVTGGTTGWVGSDLTGTNFRPLDAGLAPLGNYGGPTQTMALLPGSPAIDAGNNTLVPAGVNTDQRGLARIVNGTVDIGAFESQGFTLTVVPGSTPQTATIGTAFASPLAVSVTANNPIEPVNGGIVSFVAQGAANGASAILSASSAVVSGGQAAVTAVPDNADGSYQVVASVSGSSASFDLANAGPVFTPLIVNTTSDALTPGAGLLSLREAVDFANLDRSGNATITFDKSVFAQPQTIDLTGGQLELSNTTEPERIMGPKAGVTVDGGGLSRVFQVDTLVTASISGLTITGGNSANSSGGVLFPGSGGGILNYGSLALTNCSVSGNTAVSGEPTGTGNGGGVDNYGTLALTNCTVSNNSSGGGGGLFNNHGTATLINCTVSDNSGLADGGDVSNYLGTLTLAGCTVSGGSTRYGGGGVSNVEGTISLTRDTVTGSSARVGGGVSNYSGTATLTRCTVSGNSASSLVLGGGGMYNSGASGTAMLENCSLSGNSAFTGAGFHNRYGAEATLKDCSINGNSAAGGGGVWNDYGGTVALRDCIVCGNSASGADIFGVSIAGGGVTNLIDSTLTMTNCIVSDNSAGNSGGGGVANVAFRLFDYNAITATMTLTNCIVSGNTTTGGGGGVANIATGYRFNSIAATVTLTNCIVCGNSAGSGGGGVANVASGYYFNSIDTAVTLTNCSVSGNCTTGNGGGVATAGYRGTSGGTLSTTTTLTNCSVSGNSAAGNGGGLNNASPAATTLTNCIVDRNSAVAGGGISNQGTLIVARSLITRNRASSKGGGISTTGGSATITNSFIDGNQASSASTALGGGIDCENSLLSLTGCVVFANQANGATALGGGIYALDSTVDIANCTVTGNKANGTVLGEGGGIYSLNSGLTLADSGVHGNKATTAFNDIFNGP